MATTKGRNILTIIIGVTALISVIAALYAVFIYAPVEREQGIVQKIFYFHVSTAWVGFVAFFVVFLSSIFYLVAKDRRYDVIAFSSAEIGVIFLTLVLITGPLWGRPIWGTWWTWDSRLTTTLILWLIYVAYLMLRSYATEGPQRAKMAAVLGIIGFLDVPLIHLSVEWWRTMHPKPVVMNFKSGVGKGLPPEMLIALLVSLLAFSLLYCFLLIQRVKLETLRDELNFLKDRLRK